jgi:hypothetical protein
LGLKGSILFLEIVYLFFIFGGAAKLRWEGAQRPFWRVNEPKKTGARSARARTRGQNPLVITYFATGSYPTFWEIFQQKSIQSGLTDGKISVLF